MVDGTTVLSGSPGFDIRPLTRHHDNYLIVESEPLAKQFANRMSEMLVGAERYTPLAGVFPEEP